MIKTILTLLVLSFIVSSNSNAQNIDSSSINVREMLNNQILEIKAKQEERMVNEDILKVNSIQKAGSLDLLDKNFIENVSTYFNSDLSVKIYFMVEVIMLVGLIYLWSKKVRKNKKRKTEILKSNIKKLREEQIGSIGENNLSILRGRLRFDPIKTNDNGKDITFKARKNNIGKGEIHLAAKIQILAGEYK